MKSLLYYIGVLAINIAAAQQPFINSIDKTSGTANEIVTISGSGFSTPTVYFGNGKASSVVSSTARFIEVRVPATATYGSLRVVNSNGLSATSNQQFGLSFDKDNAGNNFSIPTLSSPLSTGSIANLSWDLCMCDFDGDGLNDVVVTNDDSFILNIFKNNSTPSSPSFSLTNFDEPDHDNTTHNVECGDVNSDGKPDLIVTSNGSGEPYIHVFENTSTAGTISFIERQRLALPVLSGGAQRLPKNVRIFDVDIDGKMDIVVGSVSDNDNKFFIFRNTITFPGTVNFNLTPVAITVPGAFSTGSIFPGDFDNDGKQDLAILSTRTSNSITIMRNVSLPNNIAFDFAGTIGSSQIRIRLAVADFNLDGMTDIVATRTSGSDGGSLELFQNTGNFNFNPLAQIASTTFSPWGLDVGDLNGDGFPDVVIGSLSNEIVYYKNNGSTGAISLAAGQAKATSNARNIRIGDLNNDGKPDIAFVDNSRDGQIGQFRYAINDLCMTPVITPVSAKYCNGSSFILSATGGQGVTYSWSVVGDTPSPVSTGTNNKFDISSYDQNITVTVTATSPDGCAIGSTSRSFTVGSASQGTPLIDDPGVLCVGDPLTLTSPTTGLANYHWSGPNGFSSTTSTPSVSVTGAVTSVHAGTYTLIVDDGDCNSPVQTRSITVSAPPITSISVSSCSNGSVTLGVPNLSGQGINYQWKRDGSIVGSNSPTFLATTPGEYTVTLTDASACEFITEGYNLFNTSFTGPTFTAPDEVCVDVSSTYTANQPSLQNIWEIEDPVGAIVSTITGSTLNYAFATTGSKKIRLITSDLTGVGCFEKTITVSPEPSYTADLSGNANKCPSDEITLSFSETDITNVIWDDTNATVGDLTTSEPGTYTPTYTTETGCEIVGTPVVITNLPGLGLSSDNPAIVDGELILNEGQTSVTLSVDMTVVSPIWNIDSGNGAIDGTGSQVIVNVRSSELSISINGQTEDGCNESETLIIRGGSAIPRKSFSPNGDDPSPDGNDCWRIINPSILGTCTLYIIDSRGANILKSKIPNERADNCFWDGTYNGNNVPEGVYYYVIKCSDAAQNQSGSILLAR